MKNDWFYAIKKSATRQKIPSFEFLLQISYNKLLLFLTKFYGFKINIPLLPPKKLMIYMAHVDFK